MPDRNHDININSADPVQLLCLLGRTARGIGAPADAIDSYERDRFSVNLVKAFFA